VLAGDRPRQKAFAARSDSYSPTGGAPGTEPDWVRQQLLDQHDLSGAVMNDNDGYMASGGRPYPDEFGSALATALNDYKAETWLDSDDRWYAAVTVAYEAAGAEKEITRCREMERNGDRWVQVLIGTDNEKPAGHPKYWPIYEAAEHYGIPVGFHVLSHRKITGTGTPNYYLDENVDFAGFNLPLVSSLVFEGVFERFPKLKIAMLELGWSWAVPLAWRMDHAYRMLRAEVPHLNRTPSEYLAEHFWFSTQPMEEPENLGWFDDVYQLFEDTLGDKLMYSSDYHHWDFDPPSVIPARLSAATRRKLLGETASDLYGIPLRPGTGLAVELATAG
jgi:predicted TIM-barrel fold metal-dependent hydrolase